MNFVFRVSARLVFKKPVPTASVVQPKSNRIFVSFVPILNGSFRWSSSVATATAQKVDKKMNQQNEAVFERLPQIAKPRNYRLHLKPYLTEFKFDGEEIVELDILKPTSMLKFYSSQLKIKEACLKLKNSNEVLTNLKVSLDQSSETAVVDLSREIQPGPAYLSLKFEGELNDKMKGFYRSKYKLSDGKDSYMATTQFESTFARQAFPCWDEPAYKATFDITLTVPKDKTALSNMNELSEKDAGDGWKTIEFATTPIMSSYLVAFIIGDLEYVEDFTSNRVRVRVYTLPEKKYQGNFALQVALKAIPFFSDYFGVPYNLPKCDLVAIPDFNFGAMENWGLVTYREVYLLLDPAKSSSIGKENIAVVVGHELAHMWFGNLTTMEWWTDLWLKEGYATWMEYYFVNDAYPDFDIFTQFLVSETLRAMSLDSLKNSHPVEVPINDPNEIEEIYDAVSYSKSASLIRMLHDYLGDQTFQNGLQNYLKKYAYKNTVTQNLWDCLSEISGTNVSELMSAWTKYMGFPLVKVSTSSQDGKVLLHLSQQRFLADGSEENVNLWQIPISITTASNPTKPLKILLTKKEDVVKLENVSPNDWIKLNAGFAGFYKVHYSSVMLKNLMSALSTNAFKPHDRLNIIGDVFSLVRSGKVSTVEFLELLQQYKNETDFTVWSEIDSAIETLHNCFQRTDAGPKFRAFCCDLYANIAAKLGWEPKNGEGHTASLLRPLVLRRLGRFGDEKTIAEVSKRFREFVDNGKDLPPDLRSMVFAITGQYQGEKAMADLVGVFEKSDFSEVQRQCLLSLGRSPDEIVQKEALNYTLSGKVRSQDIYLVFAGMTTSASGQNTAWEYVKSNIKLLAEKFSSPSSGLFTELLKITITGHCTEEKAKEVEEFFNKEQEIGKAANRPIKQSLESVRLNADLLRRDTGAVRDFLKV